MLSHVPGDVVVKHEDIWPAHAQRVAAEPNVVLLRARRPSLRQPQEHLKHIRDFAILTTFELENQSRSVRVRVFLKPVEEGFELVTDLWRAADGSPNADDPVAEWSQEVA